MSLELSGRRDELKRWQDGEAQVLAVQISAGGEGVDLHARPVFDFLLAVVFAGQIRAGAGPRPSARPDEASEHIHLVARNTVDVKIMRALEKRAEIVQSILAEIKN